MNQNLFKTTETTLYVSENNITSMKSNAEKETVRRYIKDSATGSNRPMHDTTDNPETLKMLEKTDTSESSILTSSERDTENMINYLRVSEQNASETYTNLLASDELISKTVIKDILSITPICSAESGLSQTLNQFYPDTIKVLEGAAVDMSKCDTLTCKCDSETVVEDSASRSKEPKSSTLTINELHFSASTSSELNVNTTTVDTEEKSILASCEKLDCESNLENLVASLNMLESNIFASGKSNKETILTEKLAAPVPKANLMSGDVQNKCAMQHQTPQVASIPDFPFVYYGVSVTEKDRCKLESPLVLRTKIEAMKTIKQYSDSRFRAFSNEDEASYFASLPVHLACASPLSSSVPVEIECPSGFKSVTSQQIVKLRKMIESGNEMGFLELVWSNPRYLINSADGPTIMQEGNRYNALHVAARFRQTSLCLAILSTIGDLRFLSLLYPQESLDHLKIRRGHILDMYLNTPDKGLSETPIHYASKFGAEKILKTFLSYSECEKNRLNKFGIPPKAMVCKRMENCSVDIKHRMYSMFEEDMSYIPIIRDMFNIKEPQIGAPFPTDSMMKAITSCPFVEESDHVSCAFLGPMSYKQANHFHELWKRKKFIETLDYSEEEKKILKNICRSDPLKGLERIGRKIAQDLHLDWIEYWPALDIWTDLSSRHGLKLLEQHLKVRSTIIESFGVISTSERKKSCDMFLRLVENGLVEDFLKKTPDIYANKRNITFFELFESIIPHTISMSDFSFSKQPEFLTFIHDELGHLLFLKLNYNTNNRDLADFIIYLHTQLFNKCVAKSRRWEMLSCILRYLCYYHSIDPQTQKPFCMCDWLTKDEDYYYSAEDSYYSILKARQVYYNKICIERSSHIENPAVVTIDTENLPSCSLARASLLKTSYGEAVIFNNDKKTTCESLIIPFCKLSLDFKIDSATKGNVQKRKLNSLENYDEKTIKDFIILFDEFNNHILQLILKNIDNIPSFNPTQSDLLFFREAMVHFKQICNINFPQSFYCVNLHYEMAKALFFRLISEVEEETLKKLRVVLLNIKDKSDELSTYSFSSAHEWMHFQCILKLLCHLIARTSDFQQKCACHFQTSAEKPSVQPEICHASIKELQNMYQSMKKFNVIIKEISSPSTEWSDEEFFTPPESPVDTYLPCLEVINSPALNTICGHEVFIKESDISCDDIDLFRAIEKVDIDKYDFPHVLRWKSLVESKLGSLLNPDSALSRTPASASATIRRSLKMTGSTVKRKILF